LEGCEVHSFSFDACPSSLIMHAFTPVNMSVDDMFNNDGGKLTSTSEGYQIVTFYVQAL